MYEEEYVPNQCEHIRDTGVRCGSPAMRGRDFCYYHRRLHDSPNLPGDSQYVLPALESEHAIQLATTHILRSMLKGKLSRQDAATMFQGIRIARATLRDAKKELAETPITAFEWDLTPGMERVTGESEDKSGPAGRDRDVQDLRELYKKSLCGADTPVRDDFTSTNPVRLGEYVADLAAAAESSSATAPTVNEPCTMSPNPTSPTGEVKQLLVQGLSIGNTDAPRIPPQLAATPLSGNARQRRRARRMTLRNLSNLEAITA